MKTLLWIDDDEKLIDNSIPIFRKNGFRILKAIIPSHALRILRHQKDELDGVLLDVRLGGGENGLELLEELFHIHLGIKVVVFTAYPDYSDQVDAKVAGALAYFEKVDKSIPLDPAKQATFFSALHRIFPDQKQSGDVALLSSRAITNSDVSFWVRGLFFLFAFIVVITGIAVLSQSVSAWTFPVVLVGSILLYSVVCAFLLRTHPDHGLSEKGFLALMSESLAIIPKLLRKQEDNSKKIIETNKESKETGYDD